MAEESLFTPEIRAMIGQEVDFPVTEVVDRSSIRRYAQAISDLDPLYLDEAYAKTTEYGGIIAPPTFIFDVSHNIFSDVGEDGRDLARVTIPGLKLARGGNEYQFFYPARPGDIVHQKRKIIDIYERPSKAVGKILFVVYDITHTNQEGKLLGINRETLLFFK
jgi:acyl dehydratase